MRVFVLPISEVCLMKGENKSNLPESVSSVVQNDIIFCLCLITAKSIVRP